MFKQIALLLALVPFHLSASHAGAATSASARPSTSHSSAEHDIKDRTSETPFHEADNKELAAIGKKVKEALSAAAHRDDFTGLLSLQRTNPNWFATRCCQARELGWETPLHYAVRMHSHTSNFNHLIACLITDSTQLSAPGADGLPPILMDRTTFDLSKRQAVDAFKTSQILVFDVDNPDAQDGHGKTILHSVVLDSAAARWFDPISPRPAGFYVPTFGEMVKAACYYPYQAARYFVAHGLNPDLRNAAGQTAVETIEDPRVRAQFEIEIKRGKEECNKQSAISSALQEALICETNPDSQAFKNLAPLIGSYLRVPKDRKIMALIQQFKNEARQFTPENRHNDSVILPLIAYSSKRIIDAMSS